MDQYKKQIDDAKLLAEKEKAMSIVQSKKNLLTIGQTNVKLDKQLKRSKNIARAGVHNVKNMIESDVAIMTVINQQKTRKAQIANQ